MPQKRMSPFMLETNLKKKRFQFMADIYLTESLSVQNINFFTAGYKIIHFILSLLDI